MQHANLRKIATLVGTSHRTDQQKKHAFRTPSVHAYIMPFHARSYSTNMDSAMKGGVRIFWDVRLPGCPTTQEAFTIQPDDSGLREC
jgi:hypothetical protein